MGYSGNNLKTVKANNRSAILRLLNDNGAMCRKDIAAALGLTPATVSLIVTEMMNQNILRETGIESGQSHVGRRGVLVDINGTWRYVLTANLEPGADTDIVISDLWGNPVASRKLKTDGTIPAEVFLKQIADEGRVLLWENGISREMILGMGISIPGPVQRETGISEHAYRIWEEPVAVRKILQAHLNLPVIAENNIKAFAEGELTFGRGREQEALMFVKWGPGVGSAVIVSHGTFGRQAVKLVEIGHCIIEPNGRRCRCGRRGCLETRVSTHAIAREIQSLCTPETMPVLYEHVGGDVSRITARTFSDWIGAEDTVPGSNMWKALDKIIDLMARSVANSVTLISPSEVIVYGYIFDHPLIWEHFLKAIARYAPSGSSGFFQKSRLADRAGYIGPLAVVVNEMFLQQDQDEPVRREELPPSGEAAYQSPMPERSRSQTA